MVTNFGGNVKVKFEGDWLKLNTLLNNQPLMITQAALQGQLNAAKQYKKLLKSNIRTGGTRFHYPPLSGEYIKKKGSDRMFTYTMSMHNAIDILLGKRGRSVSVGIPEGVPRTGGRETNKTVSEYATILEKGNNKQKARPIFKDTFNQFGGKWAIGMEIRKQLYIVYNLFGIKIR